MTAWQFFLSGGPLMWPILGCGVLACAVIFERIFYFSAVAKGSSEALALVLDQVKRNQVKEAVLTCERSVSPVVRLLKAGILKYDRARSQIKESLSEASLYEIPKLEKNLLLLSTIAHIAPLLGLLGTVAGLIDSFHAVYRAQSLAAAVPAADFAAGVWQALLTTCAGLTVSIIAYAGYNYFVSRVQGMVLEMERASAALLEMLSE